MGMVSWTCVRARARNLILPREVISWYVGGAAPGPGRNSVRGCKWETCCLCRAVARTAAAVHVKEVSAQRPPELDFMVSRGLDNGIGQPLGEPHREEVWSSGAYDS